MVLDEAYLTDGVATFEEIGVGVDSVLPLGILLVVATLVTLCREEVVCVSKFVGALLVVANNGDREI